MSINFNLCFQSCFCILCEDYYNEKKTFSINLKKIIYVKADATKHIQWSFWTKKHWNRCESYPKLDRFFISQPLLITINVLWISEYMTSVNLIFFNWFDSSKIFSADRLIFYCCSRTIPTTLSMKMKSIIPQANGVLACHEFFQFLFTIYSMTDKFCFEKTMWGMKRLLCCFRTRTSRFRLMKSLYIYALLLYIFNL